MGEARRRALYKLKGKDLRFIEWGKSTFNTFVKTTIVAERYALRYRMKQRGRENGI